MLGVLLIIIISDSYFNGSVPNEKYGKIDKIAGRRSAIHTGNDVMQKYPMPM